MSAPWTLMTMTEPIAGQLLIEVANGTRAAFADADLVPGLPAPDGLRETPEAVAADLAKGARLWLARAADDTVVGSVRAFVAPDQQSWEVRRLAVVPAMRGAGLARALMSALEDGARGGGAARVCLDTVVERGNPAFYARLGYRTVRHFAGPDKLLSEVTMVCDLDAPPTRLDHPFDGEDAESDYAALVTWHSDGVRTLVRLHRQVSDAVATASQDVPGWQFVGADGMRVGDDATIDRIAKELGVDAGAAAIIDGPPSSVAAYRMPREGNTDLLALWRMPAPRR